MVYHAGHGGAGAGTDGDEQRVLQIAELLAGDLLQLVYILHDFGLNLVVDLTAILVILGAGFRRNGKALGDRQTNVGHFSQIGAFTAQKLPHFAVAFSEQINVLMRHSLNYPFPIFRRAKTACMVIYFDCLSVT